MSLENSRFLTMGVDAATLDPATVAVHRPR
jgi:hypothetical protein